MKISQMFFRTVLFLLLLAAGTACENVAAEFSYRPPAFPIRVSVNSWGEVNLSAETEIDIPTPIGTASIGVIVDPTGHFKVENTLTVRFNGTDYFYDLQGKDFEVEFKSGNYKQILLRKIGRDIYLELAETDLLEEPEVDSTENLTIEPEIDATDPAVLEESNIQPDNDINTQCPGSLSSKLRIGDQAKVTIYQLNARSDPGFHSNQEHMLAKGRIVEIKDGPECADNATWWKVYFSGATSKNSYLEFTAWMPEVDYDTYYLDRVR